MKIGFIGAGNMAYAILAGIHNAGKIDMKDIIVSNRSEEKLTKIKNEFSVKVTTKNEEVLNEASDVVFLCVKPQVYDNIWSDLNKNINEKQIIVSIIAGKSISTLCNLNTNNIVRVMPNTPCLVGAGAIAVATNDKKLKDDNRYKVILDILNSIGTAIEVEEKYIDVITQVSGASPAWIFMMIEALADGGVFCGLPRDLAYKFASLSVLGSGKLAVEKGIHPGILKDMVTSPAGTTITGVKVLEDKGFRGAIIDAVYASYERSINL